MNLKTLKILTVIVAVLFGFSMVGFILLPVGIVYTPDPLNPSIKLGHATPGLVCLPLLIMSLVILVFLLLPKLLTEIEKKNEKP